VPWISDLLPVPEDATWPSHMTAPHPRATGSYGLAAEEWLWETMKLRLRWWQRLALRRQLEHDEAGALVWRTVIESTPRRSGKSVRLRAVALWRLHQAERLGEEQLILLTGKDLPIVREIIRRAWPWAISQGYPVRKANGQEEIEATDGSRWVVRGKDSVYGYDVCLGLVDEAWGVDQGVVDDGLEPALLERIQPQLVMTSTAHRAAKSLMRTRRHAALEQLAEPADVLLLQWSAPSDADPADRAAWRVASPHWTQDREDMLARTLQRIMAGTADPDPDEPDPMEAFRAQYLNIWPAPRHGIALWISPDLVSTAGSASTLDLGPARVGALAVSADGSQWSAAVADGDRALVAVGVSLEGALAFLSANSPAEVLVYQAEAHQVPTSLALAVKVVTLGEDIAAAATLSDSVRSGSIQWASQGTALAEQFANVVMAPGSGGPRIAARLSRGPVDAVVALARAHWRAVHAAPETGRVF